MVRFLGWRELVFGLKWLSLGLNRLIKGFCGLMLGLRELTLDLKGLILGLRGLSYGYERAELRSKRGLGGDGRRHKHTNGRTEIHPCVLQDISPLALLPKSKM